ncbi:Hypothetical predicted protein [Podarcis lilfordi]|uniref:Uncharacterized protein n=1 Tax=Podarcis lilfordi TaxID=74358 RepID=A0AA35PKL6_9SAUR|nr:Hypothetical predicted protein [Podarcis lilfordi]
MSGSARGAKSRAGEEGERLARCLRWAAWAGRGEAEGEEEEEEEGEAAAAAAAASATAPCPAARAAPNSAKKPVPRPLQVGDDDLSNSLKEQHGDWHSELLNGVMGLTLSLITCVDLTSEEQHQQLIEKRQELTQH